MLFSLKWIIELTVRQNGTMEQLRGTWVQLLKEFQKYSWGEAVKQDLLAAPLERYRVAALANGIEYEMKVKQ